MKKIFFLLLLAFVCNISYSQIDFTKWCIVGESPSISKHTNFINSPGSTTLIDPNEVVIIPVVFHVLYDINHPNRNIPDNLIFSQIARMNDDFTNDGNPVPIIWQPLRANTKIQFKIACIKPDGGVTDGIVRKQTTVVDFPATGGYMEAKLSSTGGDDAWPTNTYLNIWVCGMEDNILGWGTFPWDYGGSTFGVSNYLLDGIVVRYDVVGNNNGNPSGFDLGRLAVHEAGHWLGLYHLYQGSPACTPGDFVADTPLQFDAYFHCPTFPQSDLFCGLPRFPGNMFMNYMDQVYDPCKLLFTTGQKDRMRSYIAAPGPDSRYPFISNYFGILRFATPLIVQNNTITVHLKNPACIENVSYSYTGPVTELSHDDHQIIFSVTCPSSGTISLTATAANYTDNFTFDYQNLASCTTELWPKVYSYSRLPEVLLTDNSGNFVVDFLASDISQSINHVGPLPPPPPSSSENITFHYNQTGITNWYKAYASVPEPVFVLNNGDIQWSDYSYTNITNGGSVPPPQFVPAGETLIAETNSGQFITKDDNNIYVHTGSATTSVTNIGFFQAKFNKNSNKLYVIKYGSSYQFGIYQLSGNTLNLVTSNQIFESTYDLVFAQVDNQDNIYVIKNNIFQQYNPVTNSFAPITTISGFTNSNIYRLVSDNPYTENKCLVINKLENRIYSLDLIALQSRKINTINFPYPEFPVFQTILGGFRYLFEGDFLYLAGSTSSNIPNNNLSIGNQSIPVLGQLYHSVFFTKFNLITDFSSRQSEASFSKNNAFKTEQADENIFKTIVAPNPVKDLLQIRFEEKNNYNYKTYYISIINSYGNIVLNQFTAQKNIAINVNVLIPGIYYILVVTTKGEKSSRIFLKQ
jgi:Secretion system C-terminal sorting domain/Pregnancy-associated plasma protein-A